MTLLLSISPASREIVGSVVVFPLVIVTDAWALRNPLALAMTIWVPETELRTKVTSASAVAAPTSTLFVSYTLIVTGLEASTCPLSIPPGISVGVVDGMGVPVDVAVGDPSGVGVSMGVEDVGVAIGPLVNHAYVETI